MTTAGSSHRSAWALLEYFGIRRSPYDPLATGNGPPPPAPRVDPHTPADRGGGAAEGGVTWRARPGPQAVLGDPQRGSATDRMGPTDWFTLPRVAADGGVLGACQVRAASIAGRSHTYEGRTRQDDFACAVTAGGTAVVAVADGLGNPRHRFSSAGAREVTRFACARVRDALETGGTVDPDVLARAASDDLVAYAAATSGLRPVDLATTLVVCWVDPSGEFGAFGVGDSGLAVRTGDGFDQLLGGGGVVLNQVDAALPSDRVVVETSQGALDAGGALLLATDGLLVPLADPAVAGHLARRWNEPPDLLDFIHDLSFQRRGESDDRTAVCLWFSPGA